MRWQYLFVEFNTVNEFTRVLKINDIPLKEPEPQRPKRFDYCMQLGNDGWEMIQFSTNTLGDKASLRSMAVFRRQCF